MTIFCCAQITPLGTSQKLVIPDNIELIFIPPRTPEMNPIEQIWEEFKEKHFDNRFFSILEKVTDKLCDVMVNLPRETVKSITRRDWILSTV